MFTPSKLGNLFAAFGAIGGAAYAVKNKKSAQNIGLIAIGVGLGGFILGNALTNYYTSNKTTNF
jgi:Na+/phosphate symporter